MSIVDELARTLRSGFAAGTHPAASSQGLNSVSSNCVQIMKLSAGRAC
jgi:hypothetical protein